MKKSKIIERLAERVHEAWLNRRIDEGWSYGKTRSDVDKTMPCVVPYKRLSEKEKEYDRATVMAVVDGLIEMKVDAIELRTTTEQLNERE